MICRIICLLRLTFCATVPVSAHTETLESLYIRRLNMYDKCMKTARTVYIERQVGDQRLTAERDL